MANFLLKEIMSYTNANTTKQILLADNKKCQGAQILNIRACEKYSHFST